MSGITLRKDSDAGCDRKCPRRDEGCHGSCEKYAEAQILRTLTLRERKNKAQLSSDQRAMKERLMVKKERKER